MCSLGSRLQSARVISSPSKNLRLETLTSSMLLWSISSGSGERRYSSSFCSVFSSPRSRAAMRPTINVVKTLKTKSFSSLCFQYEQIILFFFSFSFLFSSHFWRFLYHSCHIFIHHMRAAFHQETSPLCAWIIMNSWTQTNTIYYRSYLK